MLSERRALPAGVRAHFWYFFSFFVFRLGEFLNGAKHGSGEFLTFVFVTVLEMRAKFRGHLDGPRGPV
jgi:hypothetical protein